MNRKTLKFAACCLAAGMTITNTGIVALAEKDVPLAGFGADSYEVGTTVQETSDVQHVMPSAQVEGEAAGQTEHIQETAAPEQTETSEQAAAPEQTEAPEETEAPEQTEAVQETEPVVDTSLNGTLAFAQCDEYINIRSGANTDSDVVGKVYNNGCVTILSQVGDWYEIQTGNATGYVRADYFATGSDAEVIANEVGYNVATVHPEALMIRSEPTEDSESVGMAYSSDELEVVSYEGDWMKVALGGDQYGYINAYYVDYDTYYATGETLEEEQARLDQEWLEYLAQQEAEQQAAEAAYAAQLAAEQQAAWDAEYQAQQAAQQAAWDAEYQAQVAAEQQAAADAQYQAQVDAEQASADAQAQADAQYQAYLEAQAAADAATQQADEQAVYDTAEQAAAEYQAYLDAQAAADAAAQAEADAAYAAQQAAEQAAAEQAAAEQAAAEQAAAEQVAAEQAAAEQAAAEQAAAEQAAAEQAAAEQAAAEQAAAEQAAAEQAAAEQAAASSGTGQSIVNFAVQFVGNPYVWGGTSLTNGADCSGFTQSVFANFGISLPRTAASQSCSGTPVDLGSIQAGDLLFYEGSGGIGHVTIYMGNGQVVHASNSNTGIIISDYGYRTPVCARRYW